MKLKKNFLQNLLSGEAVLAKTISQKNMKAVYENYRQEIDKELKETSYKFLEFILSNAEFLIHLVKDESSGIRMFEIINDRGLPIKYFDKIKALFLYQANVAVDNGQDSNAGIKNKIQQSFDKIYAYFDYEGFQAFKDKNNDDTLLRLHCLSNLKLFADNGMNLGYGDSVDDIYKSIKKIFTSPNIIPGKFISLYLDDVLKFIDAVYLIEDKIKTDIRYSDFYLILDPRQRMYALTVRCQILDILDPIVQHLEKIEFFLKSRGDPKKHIFAMLRRVLDGSEREEIIKQLDQDINNIWKWWRHEESEILKTIKWAIKFILYKMNKEVYKQQDISAEQYNSDLQMEHIFAESPDFDVQGFGFADSEDYEREIGLAGNFTLLEQKLNKSNHHPESKISNVYPKSKIKMTHSLKDFSKKSDIDSRQEKIVEFAKSYLKI